MATNPLTCETMVARDIHVPVGALSKNENLYGV